MGAMTLVEQYRFNKDYGDTYDTIVTIVYLGISEVYITGLAGHWSKRKRRALVDYLKGKGIVSVHWDKVKCGKVRRIIKTR